MTRLSISELAQLQGVTEQHVRRCVNRLGVKTEKDLNDQRRRLLPDSTSDEYLQLVVELKRNISESAGSLNTEPVRYLSSVSSPSGSVIEGEIIENTELAPLAPYVPTIQHGAAGSIIRVQFQELDDSDALTAIEDDTALIFDAMQDNMDAYEASLLKDAAARGRRIGRRRAQVMMAAIQAGEAEMMQANQPVQNGFAPQTHAQQQINVEVSGTKKP